MHGGRRRHLSRICRVRSQRGIQGDYRVFHDVEWAIANGYREFHSGSLNYDLKWHLRQSLDPIDLYVRHISPPINAVFRRLLPLLEPTRGPYSAELRELSRAVGVIRNLSPHQSLSVRTAWPKFAGSSANRGAAKIGFRKRLRSRRIE
jgi:hypothetical protein